MALYICLNEEEMQKIHERALKKNVSVPKLVKGYLFTAFEADSIASNAVAYGCPQTQTFVEPLVQIYFDKLFT